MSRESAYLFVGHCDSARADGRQLRNLIEESTKNIVTKANHLRISTRDYEEPMRRLQKRYWKIVFRIAHQEGYEFTGVELRKAIDDYTRNFGFWSPPGNALHWSYPPEEFDTKSFGKPWWKFW